MPTCAFLSFRLGLTDGVSVVAASWAEVLARLGFSIVTVAGEGPVDHQVGGLAIGDTTAPDPGAVREALADADLVVVENLCTIPLNLPAARVVADVLVGRPAILHHHDPPWQRERFAHVTELPPDDPAWRHVTINELTRRQLHDRGIEAVTIYNGFDVHEPPGDRIAVRAALDVADDELLVGHPVRAIERKGIPEAIALCEALGATYWLLGDAEEDYADTLADLLSRARCRVVRQPLPHGPDIYAAPDLVAFPSRWEGFGNPPIEAALHRRMTAVGHYPVGEELRALGFEWLDAGDHGAVERWLASPETHASVLERNRALAVEHFSLEVLEQRIAALLADAGWLA